jgi:hypothetical protein
MHNDQPFVYGIVTRELIMEVKHLWYMLCYSSTFNDTLVCIPRAGKESKPILVFRVKAPCIGYTLTQRPSRKDVFSTLKALMQAIHAALSGGIL